MSWLRNHLHSFVYPSLATMDNATWDKETEEICKLEVEGAVKERKTVWEYMPGYALIYDAVNKLETLLRGNTKCLFLTGRDTWHFYVACMRKRSFRGRAFFFPQINRHTSAHSIAVKLLTDGGLKEGDILFDTGFMGSVFTQLSSFGLPSCDCYLLSADSASKYKTLFSRDLPLSHSFFVSKANANRGHVLALEEETPKYWVSATVRYNADYNKIVQPLTDRKEFLRCAADTCLIYDGKSR